MCQGAIANLGSSAYAQYTSQSFWKPSVPWVLRSQVRNLDDVQVIGLDECLPLVLGPEPSHCLDVTAVTMFVHNSFHCTYGSKGAWYDVDTCRCVGKFSKWMNSQVLCSKTLWLVHNIGPQLILHRTRHSFCDYTSIPWKEHLQPNPSWSCNLLP